MARPRETTLSTSIYASEATTGRSYVALILHIMAHRQIGQRTLAAKTGISKTRLGVLLHRDPAKRGSMGVNELESLLCALDTDVVEAMILTETFVQISVEYDHRYVTLIVMLSDFFKSLPRKLIETLDALEGIDGSEIRKEWALPLQRAVVKRVAAEVKAVTERRARLAQGEDFSF